MSFTHKIVGKIIGDRKSKNALASYKQMKDAAEQGVWHCHGYSLEPDASCPKCGREIF